MATRKHKSKATGKVTWSYVFDAPGSSRTDRRQVALYGFTTRKEAQEAEMLRKIEVQRRMKRPSVAHRRRQTHSQL